MGGAALVALEAAKQVTAILESLTKTLRQNNPDVAAARAQVGELQQAAYQLQMENLSLQGQVGQLGLQIAIQKDELAAKTEWKTRTADIELFQAPGGAVVYRTKTGQEFYYCPTCHENRLLIPLQKGHNGNCICEPCKIAYQIEPYQSPPQPAGPYY